MNLLLLTAVGSMILTGVQAAFAQARPAVELERAITQEQVDGDLSAAIAAYQKIAADKTAPRDVRAKSDQEDSGAVSHARNPGWRASQFAHQLQEL